jgi:hypothetical protein
MSKSRADYVRNTSNWLIEQLIKLQNLRDKVLRAEARKNLRRKRPLVRPPTTRETRH